MHFGVAGTETDSQNDKKNTTAMPRLVRWPDLPNFLPCRLYICEFFRAATSGSFEACMHTEEEWQNNKTITVHPSSQSRGADHTSRPGASACFCAFWKSNTTPAAAPPTATPPMTNIHQVPM